MTLESFRRGFIGGSSLSLFIIKEFGLDKQARPTLEFMREYLAIEEEMFSRIPDALSFIVAPFLDYHNSSKLYVEIIDLLAEMQYPPTCHTYWKKGGS